MRISSMLAVLAVLPALSGCGTIYVGNVRFTSVEVCSEELASRLHPHSGCLPVTRAENVQGFYFSRFRLQLSRAEATTLTELSKRRETGETKAEDKADNKTDNKTENKAEEKNILPFWIGRVFVANSDSGAGKSRKWLAPAAGNIEFLSLGSIGSPPESAIETEIQFQTDFSGVVQKKFEAKVDIDPAKIVESALGTAGVAAAIAPTLREALVKKVVQIGISSRTFDAGKGKYTYVSMTPPQLDSLTNALAICGWRVIQATNRQEQETSGFGGRSRAAAWAGTPRSGCSSKLDAIPSLREEVKALFKDLESIARRDIEVVGIVIGVAILHTDKGRSDICSEQDIRLVDKGQSPSTTSCGDLSAALQEFVKDKPAAGGPGASASSAAKPAGATSDAQEGIDEQQKKTILAEVSAEYSRAAYKAIDIQPHTSVLAIHWIPAQIAD